MKFNLYIMIDKYYTSFFVFYKKRRKKLKSGKKSSYRVVMNHEYTVGGPIYEHVYPVMGIIMPIHRL